MWFINCRSNLCIRIYDDVAPLHLFAQVWRVNGREKVLLSGADQTKLYSGDCFIFQYSYPGDEKEEFLIGTWFGKQCVEVCLNILSSLFLCIWSFLLPSTPPFLLYAYYTTLRLEKNLQKDWPA